MEATNPAGVGGNQQFTTFPPHFDEALAAELAFDDDWLAASVAGGITQPDLHFSASEDTDYSNTGDLMEVMAEGGQLQPPVQHPLPLGLAGPMPMAATTTTYTDDLMTEIWPSPMEDIAAAGQCQPVLYPPGLAGPTAPAAYPDDLTTEVINHAPGGPWLPAAPHHQLVRVAGATAAATGTLHELVRSWNPALLGFNMQEVNAAHPQPDWYYSYSAGGSTCPSTTTTAADMGISFSSPDPEVNINNRAAGGLPQPQPQSDAGGAFTEAGSSSSNKRKCIINRSSAEADDADLVRRPDPSSAGDIKSYANAIRSHANAISAMAENIRRLSTPRVVDCHIEPPGGSTSFDIIQLLEKEKPKLGICSTGNLNVYVNHSRAALDLANPGARRRYVTTMRMQSEPDPGEHGCWKETKYEMVKSEGEGSAEKQQWLHHGVIGVKREFRFYKINGKETPWVMHEYVPTTRWGYDMYMEDFCFHDIFQDPGKQRVKNTKNRIVKHRMRGPDDLCRLEDGESPAWKHFIKIYDRHPDQDGSKVVYALCCRCEKVLKAGNENGTKSLLTHCDRTCEFVKNKNKNQQPRSSRE